MKFNDNYNETKMRMDKSKKFYQTTMTIWKNEFINNNRMTNEFIEQIYSFSSLHYLNDDDIDCYLGYIIQTKYRKTYVYGKQLCDWLSSNNNPILMPNLQQINQLNNKTLKQIDYGLDFFLILTDDGYCYLASDDPDWNTNKSLKLLHTNIKQISCGHEHLLLLPNDEPFIIAMGWNGLGQLTNYCSEQHSHVKFVKIPLANVEKICSGWAHSLAMITNYNNNTNRIYSWGLNESGRLGLNDEQNRFEPELVRFSSKSNNDYPKIKDIVCGAAHTLFLLENGQVYGCGYNCNGELGSKKFGEYQLSPRLLPVENVEKIVTNWSYRFTIAFIKQNSDNGNLYSCYVWGEFGQNDNLVKLYQPTKIQLPNLMYSNTSLSTITSMYFDPPLTFGLCFIVNQPKNRTSRHLSLKYRNFTPSKQIDPEQDFVNMMVKRFSLINDNSLTFP